jgi:hypothetical protein
MDAIHREAGVAGGGGSIDQFQRMCANSDIRGDLEMGQMVGTMSGSIDLCRGQFRHHCAVDLEVELGIRIGRVVIALVVEIECRCRSSTRRGFYRW